MCSARSGGRGRETAPGFAAILEAVQRITLEPIGDLTSVGRRWRALEARSDGGFFRGWVFLGCQAEARFAGARLLCVSQDGADVALALIGSGQGRTWLNQTGQSLADSVFIEHNGMLVQRGCEAVVAPALRYAVRQAGALVMSGVDDSTLAAARAAGWLDLKQSRFAPCVDFATLDRPYLQTLSANARAQIRRSMRLYGAGLRLERAATLDAAQGFFVEMVGLHQAAWQRRGRPGAFAEPAMRAFHQALIARAWPVGAADLLRISSGAGTIGVLYNFVSAGRVLSYQSGFGYAGADNRDKPGLVCHAMAIEHYAGRGALVYDLLAGADRYKTSLGRSGQTLHWAVLSRWPSIHGMLRTGQILAKRFSDR